MEEMIPWLEMLKKDMIFYKQRASDALLKAETNLIDNILDLYKEL